MTPNHAGPSRPFLAAKTITSLNWGKMEAVTVELTFDMNFNTWGHCLLMFLVFVLIAYFAGGIADV